MKTLTDIKTSLLRILIFFVPLLFTGSCSLSGHHDDLIYDFWPVEINIRIQDDAGQNLLSPFIPGNLQGRKITAEYQGQMFELDWDAEDNTRYYMPRFSGLTLNAEYKETENAFITDPSTNYLSFGEFDGAENQEITILLHIEGYSRSWKITRKHVVKWNGDHPQVTNSATINYKPVQYDDIIIKL